MIYDRMWLPAIRRAPASGRHLVSYLSIARSHYLSIQAPGMQKNEKGNYSACRRRDRVLGCIVHVLNTQIHYIYNNRTARFCTNLINEKQRFIKL